MARLLVLNPNTTAAVTEAFVAEARRVAPAGTNIAGVTGDFGAAIVSTEAEHAIAAHSALVLAARHAAGWDAVILAISFDSGWEALRSLLPMPVIPITRTSLRAAPSPVGVVVFGHDSRSLYGRVIASAGVEVAGIEVIGIAGAADYLSAARRDDAVVAACARLVDRGAAGVVVCGAVLVGMAARLQARVAVPLSDGGAPAVAAALARIGRAPAPRPRPLGPMSGIAPELAALIGGRWP